MTTLDQIIALETERTRLYQQTDLPLSEGMRREARLKDIEAQLYDLWDTRRRELARRHGVSADTSPQGKGRWT